MNLLQREPNGTWRLTKSTMQSMNSQWYMETKILISQNLTQRVMIVEKVVTKKPHLEMMKSTTPLHIDKEVQTVETNESYKTSSTTSSPMNKELLLEMGNVSSARRKDISIEIVQQGRHILNEMERTAWLLSKQRSPSPNCLGKTRKTPERRN